MARKTTIIAEIGENHLGYWDIAIKMVEGAARNGADIANSVLFGRPGRQG